MTGHELSWCYRKQVCVPTHSDTKQYIRVWNRERFIAGLCKDMNGSCLKNPKLPENFQQITFIGKMKEGCGREEPLSPFPVSKNLTAKALLSEVSHS